MYSYAAGSVVPVPGTVNVYSGYQVTLEYAPQFAGEPGVSKQFKETTLHFHNANTDLLSATFRTDLATSSSTTPVSSPSYAPATTPVEFLNLRLITPLEKQRGNMCRVGLSIKEAWSMWQLAGYSMDVEGVSQRNVR